MQLREVTVVSVDPEDKTATVKLDYGTTKDPLIIPDVRILAFSGGNADGKMPEEGEPWLAISTSESAQQWFLLKSRDNEGSINRILDPGDHGWSLPNGSRVLLRKSGNIEIFSNATSSFYMLPARDLVQLNIVNFEVIAPQGSIQWSPSVLDIIVGHDIGESSVHFRFGDTGVAWGVRDWAGSGGETRASAVCGAFHTEVDEFGNVSLEGNMLGVSVLDALGLEVDGPAYLKFNAGLEVEGIDVVANSTTLHWTAKTQITLQAQVIKFDTSQLILTEEDGFAIDGIAFLSWLMGEFKVLPNGSIDPFCIPGFINTLNFKVML